jgi:hypothetical protein
VAVGEVAVGEAAVGEAAIKTDGWVPSGMFIFLFGMQAAPPAIAERIKAEAIWFFFTDSP